MTAFVPKKSRKIYSLMVVNREGEMLEPYSNRKRSSAIYAALQDTSIVKRFKKNDIQMSNMQRSAPGE